MSRISWIGAGLAVLGAIAYFVHCPYGVHIIVAGVIVALIGMFVRPQHASTEERNAQGH
jgi:hypothetical protein